MKKYLSNLIVVSSLFFAGCGCESVPESLTISTIADMRGPSFVTVKRYYHSESEVCPTFPSGGGTDMETWSKTDVFLLGLRESYIRNITEDVKMWDSLLPVENLWRKYGMAQLEDGTLIKVLGQTDSIFQTWIWPAKQIPQKLGKTWGHESKLISTIDNSIHTDIDIGNWKGDSIVIRFNRKKSNDSTVQSLWIQDLKTGNASPILSPEDTVEAEVFWRNKFPGYARVIEKSGSIEIIQITNNSKILSQQEWDSLVVNKTMDTLIYKGWKNWK